MTLTLFEDITAKLNEQEKELARIVAKALKRRVGTKNVISNRDICRAINGGGYRKIKLTSVRLRKIINYIRNNDLCSLLICSSKGYYIASDEVQVRAYMKSLQERADAILHVRDSIGRQLRHFQKQKI